MQNYTFTLVDVETTGASSSYGRVIEVGLLRVEHGEVVRTYKSLINPEQAIPEFISRMTGIRDTDVLGAPTFADVADELLELFSGSVFVAHNAPFDYSFVRAEFKRLGYGFTVPRLCTVQLSRAVYPEFRHHNLSAIIERHNFTCLSRHRAYDDAEVLWQFLKKLEQTIPAEELEKHLKRLISAIHPVPTSKKQETFVYERDMDALDALNEL